MTKLQKMHIIEKIEGSKTTKSTAKKFNFKKNEEEQK